MVNKKWKKKSGFWRSGASLRILTCFFCFYCFYVVFICWYFVFISFYFVFICSYLFLLFLFVFICFYFVVICFYLFFFFFRKFAPGGGGDFLHTSLVILTVWSRGRRLKRSNLSPNHYFYNVWATSWKSFARRISGRRKRSDCYKK